jgi:hypothetical protein
MTTRLGDRLIAKNHLTERQLEMALERQRLHGGRLGNNLVALGLLSEEEVLSFFKRTPPAPRAVEHTGLELSFIADLITKHTVFMGEFTLSDVADRVKLPLSVVDTAIEILRREHFAEVKSANQNSKLSYKFSVTEQGKNRANDLFDISRYIGPAP